jgi:heme oxygenase
MEQTSILSELKDFTKKAHNNIENNPLTKGIIEQTIDKKNYIHLLEKFYGYYFGIEQKLANIQNWKEFDFKITDRLLKCEWLKQDLLALGKKEIDLQKISICKNIPAIDQISQAIGVLYVMEGSTLGGQIQKKFLHQHLSIDEVNGGKFFTAYGKEHIAIMWKNFQDFVMNFDKKYPQNRKQILESANQTFETLDAWLKT